MTNEHDPRGDHQELDLTPAQERVIAARVAGKNWTEAAEAGDVSRSQVWRWRDDDPDFKAALNRRKREFRDAVRQNLREAAKAASAAVRLDIVEGNSELAFELLQETGMLDSELYGAGPTELEELRDRLEWRRSVEEESKRMMETIQNQQKMIRALVEGFQNVLTKLRRESGPRRRFSSSRRSDDSNTDMGSDVESKLEDMDWYEGIDEHQRGPDDSNEEEDD